MFHHRRPPFVALLLLVAIIAVCTSAAVLVIAASTSSSHRHDDVKSPEIVLDEKTRREPFCTYLSKHYTVNPFRILLVGMTGAGKTSMLLISISNLRLLLTLNSTSSTHTALVV